MLKLYQFPFSHYCEKARWALDYKGVAWQPVNLLPGLHERAVRKLAPKSCVPVLVEGNTAIQESAAIISYLDTSIPLPALTPDDASQAREALEWEAYLDEEIGVTLRLWYYHHALPDRNLTLRQMLEGAPRYARPLYLLAYANVRAQMKEKMDINDDSARRSKDRLLAALERLDEALDKRRFLVGDRFSRADLTACALLSPFCLPDDAEAAAKFPPPFRAQRDQARSRRFYRWVRNVYDTYRDPMPAC